MTEPARMQIGTDHSDKQVGGDVTWVSKKIKRLIILSLCNILAQ